MRTTMELRSSDKQFEGAMRHICYYSYSTVGWLSFVKKPVLLIDILSILKFIFPAPWKLPIELQNVHEARTIAWGRRDG